MHKQLLLPGTPPISPDYIVNVASVAHRSPFRYPGGKTWLVPHIRQWLATYAAAPTEFIEPFAGGGIIGLSVAFEKLCNHVVFAEMDDEVASVWETILGDNGEWLADQIIEFDLEREAVEQFLKREDTDLREKALQTIIKNRVNRGGILAPGAGMIKNGENGKGIASRWYPKTLYKRIHNIIKIKDRITFIHGDAFELLSVTFVQIEQKMLKMPQKVNNSRAAPIGQQTACERKMIDQHKCCDQQILINNLDRSTQPVQGHERRP